MTQVQNIKQENKVQEIHRQKYLAAIRLLPDLKQKKVKEYFQAIITLITLILAIAFAINPTLTTISDLDRQIADATTVDNALRAKVKSLEQLSTQYNSLQADLPAIDNAVPQSEDAQLLLAEIQALAQKDNIKISALNTQLNPTLNTEQYKILTFNISTAGPYNDIITFINDIKSFQRVILPTSITISKNIENNGWINLSLNGNAYYQL